MVATSVQRILLIVLVVLALNWVIRLVLKSRPRSQPGSRFKCVNCRHRRGVFEDGVVCGYGAREAFKKPVHIEMCQDWQQG
jgi:hypothetical protein